MPEPRPLPRPGPRSQHSQAETWARPGSVLAVGQAWPSECQQCSQSGPDRTTSSVASREPGFGSLAPRSRPARPPGSSAPPSPGPCPACPDLTLNTPAAVAGGLRVTEALSHHPSRVRQHRAGGSRAPGARGRESRSASPGDEPQSLTADGGRHLARLPVLSVSCEQPPLAAAGAMRSVRTRPRNSMDPPQPSPNADNLNGPGSLGPTADRARSDRPGVLGLSAHAVARVGVAGGARAAGRLRSSGRLGGAAPEQPLLLGQGCSLSPGQAPCDLGGLHPISSRARRTELEEEPGSNPACRQPGQAPLRDARFRGLCG